MPTTRRRVANANIKENQVASTDVSNGPGTAQVQHRRSLRSNRLLKQFEPNLRQDEADTKQSAGRKRQVKMEVSPERSPSPTKIPSPWKREVKSESPEEDTTESDVETEEELVSYEQLREQNLRANAEFIAKLGILEAKQQLAEINPKKTTKPSQRGLKREKVQVEVLPRRRSLRIQNVGPPKPVYVPDELATAPDEHPRPQPGPLKMVEYLIDQQKPDVHEEFMTLMNTGVELTEYKPMSTNLKSYLKDLSEICLKEECVAKVVKNRIFSLAIHPRTDKVLVAAGDKWGQIGFWDVHSKSETDGVVVYSPHARPVNCLRLPVCEPLKCFSCSYDGSLRRGDFEKGIFDEIYSCPEDEDTLLRNFDFHSEQVLLVSQTDGCVGVVDVRTSNTTAEHLYPCHLKYLRTVSIHPLQKNYFVTASVDRTICLWDLRKMSPKKNKPIVEMSHGKSVDSAYFSPVTGKYILTASADNTLNIFDSSSLTSKLCLKKSIRHDNHVGRWLTKFRATWHPAREDLFVVGSMKRPRQIELFNDEGAEVMTLKSECLGSVCSLNEIHPTQNIVVGGNSSGRVHIFM